MADPKPNPDAGEPAAANKRNEKEASEADKRTVENIRKNQSKGEKSKPEFRPGS